MKAKLNIKLEPEETKRLKYSPSGEWYICETPSGKQVIVYKYADAYYEIPKSINRSCSNSPAPNHVSRREEETASDLIGEYTVIKTVSNITVE